MVALDVDPRFIEDEQGIEARQADILVDDIEPDTFDLVHCRALLHHLPGREVIALRRMAAALRPGGVLVAEEPWFGAMFGSPTPACAAVWKAFDEAMPSADYLWAVALPRAFHEAGLAEVEWCGDAQVIRGGSPDAELLRLSVEAVRERIPADPEINGGMELLSDPDTFEPGVVWYSAWGVRRVALDQP